MDYLFDLMTWYVMPMLLIDINIVLYTNMKFNTSWHNSKNNY